MEQRPQPVCPDCQRTIYSRRRTTCEWCGKPLPEKLRLTEGEIAAMDAELARIEHDRTLRRAKEAKEWEAQRKPASAYVEGSILNQIWDQ